MPHSSLVKIGLKFIRSLPLYLRDCPRCTTGDLEEQDDRLVCIQCGKSLWKYTREYNRFKSGENVFFDDNGEESLLVPEKRRNGGWHQGI